MTRRGRPLGFVSRALLEAFAERPGLSVRTVANDLRLSYGRARVEASRMVSRGQLVQVGEETTGRRPAALLAPAESARSAEPAQQPGADLHFVMGMMIRSGRR